MRTNTVYANSYPQEVRAAIYCRLSKDDDLSGPSASIQNQRELLCSYCEEQGWRVAGIFQDDGYTGLNMDRPDFQRMLGAVERGMFDVILTKDLSRLGRNYLQTGQLIEEFFPKNRVRYIALNDAVDSNIENDITPFRNILKNKRCLGGGTTKGGFMNFQMDKLQVLLHTAFTRPDRQSGKTL